MPITYSVKQGNKNYAVDKDMIDAYGVELLYSQHPKAQLKMTNSSGDERYVSSGLYKQAVKQGYKLVEFGEPDEVDTIEVKPVPTTVEIQPVTSSIQYPIVDKVVNWSIAFVVVLFMVGFVYMFRRKIKRVMNNMDDKKMNIVLKLIVIVCLLVLSYLYVLNGRYEHLHDNVVFDKWCEGYIVISSNDDKVYKYYEEGIVD